MIALYRKFFARLPVRPVAGDEHLHLLSAEEVRFVRRRHRQALVVSASLSVAGFLVFYDMVQANGMVDDTPDKRFDTPRDYWYTAGHVMRAGPEVHSYADRWADVRGYQIWEKQKNRV